MKHKGIKGVFIAGIIVIAVFAGVRIVQTNGSDSASANGASLPSAEKVPGWQMWDISDYKNANPWSNPSSTSTGATMRSWLRIFKRNYNVSVFCLSGNNIYHFGFGFFINRNNFCFTHIFYLFKYIKLSKIKKKRARGFTL